MTRAILLNPDVLATIEDVHRQRSSRTLAEAFSDVRAACLEERYELELPERRDREVCLGADS